MGAFSSYKLLAKMGQGGMAEVYKAEKIGPDRFSKTVALKKILPYYSDLPRFIKMLSTEARIHSYLNHPNIVQIQDFFEESGQYCMVLEFVDGKNLKEIMAICKKKKISLSWQASVFIALEILKALSYAHEKQGPEGPLQIIHRDVSPHNILISFAGEVKLSDFGIARAKIERDETASGVLKGKYRYLSPEQILTEALTPSSDLFSVGITLYEMLSFQHPFGEAQEYQTLQKIVDQPHKPLIKILPNLKPELDAIIEQALQKNPRDRYQSAKDFYEDLLEIQDPSWVTHGQELFSSILESVGPSEVEPPIESTVPLPKQITVQHSLFDVYSARNSPKKFSKLLWGGITVGLIAAFFYFNRDSFRPIPETPVPVNPVQIKLVPQVQSQSVQKIPIDLRRPTGNLDVSGPKDTILYVNGKKMGNLPLSTLKLPVGSYTLLFQNDKLGKKMKTVTVSQNQTSRATWE